VWGIDEALEGSLRAGRSRGGRANVFLDVRLRERTVYKLQRLLEGLAEKSENWFEIREVVMLSEEVRMAVRNCQSLEARETRDAVSIEEGGGYPQGV